MEFKRKVYDKMLKWKNEYAPNYSLFLKGARRVGKSTLALKLGKEEYTVEKVVKKLEYHLCEETLGNISEIFDGDYPHTPRGCFAQAWSVAEILQRMKN